MSFLLVALLCQDPQAWIDRLGDPDPAVREEATQHLVDLGDTAQEALAAARAGATDPEVAGRIDDILAAIERERPMRAILHTPPPLTVEPGLLPDVAAALASHFGVEITGDLPDCNLGEPLENATLLQACDAIARAAEMTYSIDEGGIRFSPGAPPLQPAAYSGPFKFWLPQVEILRSTDFAAPTAQLTLHIMGVHQSHAVDLPGGTVRIDEITVDTGERLEPGTGVPDGGFPMVAGGLAGARIMVVGGGNVVWQQGTSSDTPIFFGNLPPAAQRIESIRGRAILVTMTDTGVWEWDALGRASSPSSRGPCTATVDAEPMEEYFQATFRIAMPEMERLLQDPATLPRIVEGTRLTLYDANGEEIQADAFEGGVNWQAYGGQALLTGVWNTGGRRRADRMRLEVPTRAAMTEVPFEIRGVDLP